MKVIYFALLLVLTYPGISFADGCNPGDPCWGEPVAAGKALEPSPAVEPIAESPEAVAEEPCCEWGNRIAAGVPVWSFQEEDTEVGGGLYFDIYPCDYPLNFRIGAEVNHMDLDQPNAASSAEFDGRKVNITFVRIPFAIEYAAALAERTSLFVGGGPNIIRTANDVSDTSVGMHLSARILQNFSDHFGIALEAGYMWGEVNDDGGGDIDLDNTFIIPTLTYTF